MIEKARRQKTPAKTREQHVQESAKQHRLANMSNWAKNNNELMRKTTAKNKVSTQIHT